MLSLMDEIFCFQCFCTEKYEKCVRPDKDLSLKAAPQGQEKMIKRLLFRNRATGQPICRKTRQPGCQATGYPGNRADRHPANQVLGSALFSNPLHSRINSISNNHPKSIQNQIIHI